jgi:drug/metabolite transporter (DMT)-like permease
MINTIKPNPSRGAITLIVLIIFSYFVLNEDITKVEIFGIILIILGVVLATAFNPNPSNVQSGDFNFFYFIIIVCILSLLEGILIIISKLSNYKAAGLILGSTAGTLMGFQTVSKRVTAIPDPYLQIIFSIMTMIMAVLTLILTQFAFSKSKANRVVPCFTSASISLSIFIGVITLNELIIPIQLIGIGIVVLGVIFLTAFRKESE